MNRALTRLRRRVLPNLRHLFGSRLRSCRCCDRLTVVISLSPGEEVKRCLRCGANLRYEMLAEQLRQLPLHRLDVLELDGGSPLRRLLERSRTYTRSFFGPGLTPGTVRADGARCEDITQLTLADASCDLIVSSDVLEHVPDLATAFAETARVLRPGGAHLFTVPPRQRTRRRGAEEPEYHGDPLNPGGILAHWDIGPDAPAVFDTPGLRLEIVAGPEGSDRRIVWRALRT